MSCTCVAPEGYLCGKRCDKAIKLEKSLSEFFNKLQQETPEQEVHIPDYRHVKPQEGIMDKHSSQHLNIATQPLREEDENTPMHHAQLRIEQALRARRNRIAEGFAFALASHDPLGEQYSVVGIAKFAVAFADALIAELDK